MRFKLSGCSLLCFDNGEEPMLGEHCSASVYSPRELRYERLTCEPRSALLRYIVTRSSSWGNWG